MSFSAALSALTVPPPGGQGDQSDGHPRRDPDACGRALAPPGCGRDLSGCHAPLVSCSIRRATVRRPAPLTWRVSSSRTPIQLRVPVSMSTLVADQLTDFKRRFAAVNLSYARAHHLTAYDVLIVASLIQAEAQTSHDFPLVASTIYNRLRINMPLELDSTTRYATGNYNHPLTVSQLHSSSPWNTHTHPGLPPTPIDNPGLGGDPGRRASGPDQLPVLREQALPQRRPGLLLQLLGLSGQRPEASGGPRPLRPRLLSLARAHPPGSRGLAGPAQPLARRCTTRRWQPWADRLALPASRHSPGGIHRHGARRFPMPGSAGSTSRSRTRRLPWPWPTTPARGRQAIGAANLLLFEDDGTISADNTDAPAIAQARSRTPAAGGRALVLGAGGSARAAVWALRQAEAEVFDLESHAPSEPGNWPGSWAPSPWRRRNRPTCS